MAAVAVETTALIRVAALGDACERPGLGFPRVAERLERARLRALGPVVPGGRRRGRGRRRRGARVRRRGAGAGAGVRVRVAVRRGVRGAAAVERWDVAAGG